MARQRVGEHRPGGAPAPHRGPGRSRPVTLGVDVGGVIVMLAGRDEDTSFFGGQPLRTPAVPEVFEVLAALTAEPFAGRMHVVSKAGPGVAANTRAWLAHHEFFDRTGIPADNLHFVRDRRDKAPVCERLGVTHFVDDRLDVLAHLATVEHRYLFLGGNADRPPPGSVPDWATVTDTWAALGTLLPASVSAPTADRR
ncbi:hypothetical protein O7626_15580 [Micromonospora sp. WMMD1102]|uniref:hypothetical protein n=1 Tax=Micromonospora sp. WMMD1102 TaxID=3016105 RepID=UPI0024153337|nr:hypothetical protein [Micromonospora sp. WMMD1102]MDG4787335.1 hypothetical protein [Micromonospora sp. WMMD1102]